MSFIRKVSLIAGLTLALGVTAQTNPLWMRYSAISPDGQTIAFSYKGAPPAGMTVAESTALSPRGKVRDWTSSETDSTGADPPTRTIMSSLASPAACCTVAEQAGQSTASAAIKPVIL